MRELEFLCLAVSRREGGNCIAGIDLGSGHWIRPVNTVTHGALVGSEILVADELTRKPREMRTLDVVELRVDKYVGNSGQPENWTLAPVNVRKPHSLVSQRRNDPSLHWKIRELATESVTSGLLFGNDAKSVSHAVIQSSPLSSSLCIAQPRYLRWQRDVNFRGTPCIDGYFDLREQKIRHVIRLTDVVWEKRLLDITRKEALFEHSDLPEGGSDWETFLTVSLGDLFRQKGQHYKLIAGVLILPRP